MAMSAIVAMSIIERSDLLNNVRVAETDSSAGLQILIRRCNSDLALQNQREVVMSFWEWLFGCDDEMDSYRAGGSSGGF